MKKVLIQYVTREGRLLNTAFGEREEMKLSMYNIQQIGWLLQQTCGHIHDDILGKKSTIESYIINIFRYMVYLLKHDHNNCNFAFVKTVKFMLWYFIHCGKCQTSESNLKSRSWSVVTPIHTAIILRDTKVILYSVSLQNVNIPSYNKVNIKGVLKVTKGRTGSQKISAGTSK